MVPHTGVLRHAAKTEQGWLSQIHHQPGRQGRKEEGIRFPCQQILHLAEVKRPRKEPDNSIEEGLVAAVLGEDGQEVTLQDLCSPQLLPHVSRLVLMPQVADQILHTLFKENKTPTCDPRSQKKLPLPIRSSSTQPEEFTRPQSMAFSTQFPKRALT